MGNGKSFEVTTEKLGTAAEALSTKIASFKAEYEKLYTEVSTLKSAEWQGVASEAFSAALDGYRDQFVQAEDTLKKFVTNLTTSKTNYESTEETIRQNASTL